MHIFLDRSIYQKKISMQGIMHHDENYSADEEIRTPARHTANRLTFSQP